MTKKFEIHTTPDSYCLSGSSPPSDQSNEPGRVAALILAFLEKLSSPVAEKMILKTVKARRQIKVREIRWLLTNGHIERLGLGTKSSPYLYQATRETPGILSAIDNEPGEEIFL